MKKNQIILCLCLCITGISIAFFYLNKPNKTHKTFVNKSSIAIKDTIVKDELDYSRNDYRDFVLFFEEQDKLPYNIHQINKSFFLQVDTIPNEINPNEYWGEKSIVLSIPNSTYENFTLHRGYYKGEFKLEKMQNIALKNVKFGFSYYSLFDECPGASQSSIFLINGKKIVELIGIKELGDDSESEEDGNFNPNKIVESFYEEKKIFLPVKIGKSILYKEFSLHYPAKNESVKYYNKKIKNTLPQKELYFVETTKIRHRSKQDGTFHKTDTLTVENEFYKWDGEKGKLIEKIKRKK